MRIQHNIMAMNAYRNYTNNTSALSKNLEKLSSGYKINRAGDDAAGLAISEKMRAQITGLNKAQDNAKDGISLVQTAEGALTEVHDMLNRMYELAEQSANGTYEDETDRTQLQKEVTQLKDEINRIADSANFNGIKLLDGSLSEAKIDITNINLGGATTTTTTAATSTKSEFTMAAPTGANEYTLTVEYLDANGKSNKVDIKYTAGADQKTTGEAVKAALEGNSEISSVFDVAVDVSGKLTLTSKATGADGAKVIGVSTTDTGKVTMGTVTAGADSFVTATGGAQGIADGDTLTLNGRTYEFVKDTSTAPKKDGAIAVVLGADDAASVANLKKALEGTGVSVEINNTNDLKFTADKNGSALTLQIGDTSESWNQLKVTINDCHTTALGIADLNISNQSDAASALDVIKNAINYVSDVRGTLGATQNRLDHTINNLSVMEENIQDAESTIRDTDVADEMMAYTKNNILIQSAQAMLAQANQVPQGVLQLLQ
ncbi:MAG TPA: flagellin [Firmicutes bacterium]|nr:flagellin [Bacillota bacterium]